MSDDSNRYGSEPLGKSVEQVELETGNLRNSPVEGEVVRDTLNQAVVIPTTANTNATGTPGAVVNTGALVDTAGMGADDGTARPSRESSEG